jgi:hypothetical protein
MSYDGPLWSLIVRRDATVLRYVIIACPTCGRLAFLRPPRLTCRTCTWLTPVERALWRIGCRPAPAWWPVPKKGPPGSAA